MNHVTEKTNGKQAIVWALLCLLLVVPSGVGAQEFVPTAFVAWSPDGTMLAVGSGTMVQIVDFVSLQSLHMLSTLDEQRTEPVWSPDGTRLAVAGSHGVEIWRQPWSPGTAQQIATYQDAQGVIRALAWSPDGTQIATTSAEVILIWRVSDDVTLQEISGNWSIITDLEWSTDGRLAMATGDSVVANFNPDTGQLISYFYTSTDIPTAITSIAFSPDNNQLVFSNEDGLIQIWGDTRTTETLSQAPRITFDSTTGDLNIDRVNSVDWHPNGRYIVSSGNDGNVRIWDAVTGEQIQVIEVGAHVHVNSVAWSPNGTQLAYGAPEGTFEIIPAPDALAQE